MRRWKCQPLPVSDWHAIRIITYCLIRIAEDKCYSWLTARARTNYKEMGLVQLSICVFTGKTGNINVDMWVKPFHLDGISLITSATMKWPNFLVCRPCHSKSCFLTKQKKWKGWFWNTSKFFVECTSIIPKMLVMKQQMDFKMTHYRLTIQDFQSLPGRFHGLKWRRMI